jgi:hypothetical protein
MKKHWLYLLLTFSIAASHGQDASTVFRASGTPENPKVPISWNRWYDYDGITAICRSLAEAHPDLIRLSSIGQSYQGREMWALTITDFTTGDADRKPGFYMDGNIHSNEIQGAEFALYTAWYLAENQQAIAFIKKLLEEKVFYIIPTINPDARENYMKQANSYNTPRSGVIPVDDDRDGSVNEDGYDDINGDGHITLMRRKNPFGRYRPDEKDPRNMKRVEPDQYGTYDILGYEGQDNDGDGRVNEDPEGYYDPNRDWGWNWQPGYVQRGAYKYPFSLPETDNVRKFVTDHANIAGAQSFHNTGGMILRGPGVKEDAYLYAGADQSVYNAIAAKGKAMLPGYNYLVIYKDLYSTYGNSIDWFFGCRGIFSFTNEIFTHFLLDNSEKRDPNKAYFFDKYLLFEDAFVPWKEYDHPQFGNIEVGGFKKNARRVNPGFLIESDAHRNMAFVLYHAFQTPRLFIESIEEKPLGKSLTQIDVRVRNDRMIPTHAVHDIKNRIVRPDYVILEGAEVIAGMRVDNPDLNLTTEQIQNPEKLEVQNIPGMGSIVVRWIVRGGKDYTITVDSAKGGITKQTKRKGS